MKLFALHLPEEYLSALEDLVHRGAYPSVAEAIRDAVRIFLANHGYLPYAPRDAVGVDEETARYESPVEAAQYEVPRPGRKSRVDEMCEVIAEVCGREPWRCLSKALLAECVPPYYIDACAGGRYVAGYRVDFVETMARDIAAYVASICNKQITVSARAIAEAAGLPPTQALRRVIVEALRRLPGQELDTAVRKFTLDCEKLRPLACDARLATVKYAYYAKRGDVEMARECYAQFKQCLLDKESLLKRL